MRIEKENILISKTFVDLTSYPLLPCVICTNALSQIATKQKIKNKAKTEDSFIVGNTNWKWNKKKERERNRENLVLLCEAEK